MFEWCFFRKTAVMPVDHTCWIKGNEKSTNILHVSTTVLTQQGLQKKCKECSEDSQIFCLKKGA